MAIKRLVTAEQAKSNVLDKLHKQLSRDNVMGRNTVSLIAKIKQIEAL